MTDNKITVLVPGRMHPRVLERLAQAFDLIQTPVGAEMQVTEEQRAKIRGVATTNKMPAEWIDQVPNAQVIANFGVGYDGVRCRLRRFKGRACDQHARCVER